MARRKGGPQIPAQRCIYCGQTGVTKEHIWGQWSQEKAPPDSAAGIRNEHHLIRYPDRYDRKNRIRLKGKMTRPGNSRAQTMRVVCGPCNNGWMSKIQDTAKAPLTALGAGNWQEFDGEAQHSVALWAAMFTMTCEFDDRETVCIPQQERARFSVDRTLTDHWHIAVGKKIGPCYDAKAHRAFTIADRTGETYIPITIWEFGDLLISTMFAEPKILKTMEMQTLLHNLRTIHPFRAVSNLDPSICMPTHPVPLMESIFDRLIQAIGKTPI